VTYGMSRPLVLLGGLEVYAFLKIVRTEDLVLYHETSELLRERSFQIIRLGKIQEPVSLFTSVLRQDPTEEFKYQWLELQVAVNDPRPQIIRTCTATFDLKGKMLICG
jgi:hypothetical protein